MRLPRESTPLVRNRRMTSTSGVSRLCSVDARLRGLPQVVCLLPPQLSSALLSILSMYPHFLRLPFLQFPWIMDLELHQNNSSPIPQVAGSYARAGCWWCLPVGSLGPECSSCSLTCSSWPSLDPHCTYCRVAPLPAGPSTPWPSVNSTGSLATQEALVVDCSA